MTIASIATEVADDHKVTVAELKGQGRSHRVVRARHCVCWRARKELGVTLNQVGRFLGGRDHTTILHGELAYQKLIDKGVVEKPVRAQIEPSKAGEDWTLEEYEQARHYRELGLSFRDIATLTGRSIGSCAARLSRVYRGRNSAPAQKVPKKPTHANRTAQTEAEKLRAQNDAYVEAMHTHYPGKTFQDVKLRSRSRSAQAGQNGAQLYG